MNQGGEHIEVLFVDDEQSILDGLRRQARGMRGQWNARFAIGGADALAQLEVRAADIVISDMRMPEMSGAELLRAVRDRWPGTVRVVLSGQTDQAQLIQDIGAIHQFLQKPCDFARLADTVNRVARCASLVEAPEHRSIVAGIECLPVTSETYTSLLRLLEDEECDLGAVVEVVSRDVGLSVKLMQMVNSAFFGLPRRVDSVKEAVTLLGVSNLKFLTVTARLFESLMPKDSRSVVVSQLWSRSIDVGALAGRLASEYGQPRQVSDAARLAGTLSMIGRSVLVAKYYGAFVRAQALHDPTLPLWVAEQEQCGIAQQNVGAYALGLWAFDADVSEAVAHQANPGESAVRSPEHPLPWVHVARSRIEAEGVVERLAIDQNWLESCGLGSLGQDVERDAA